MRQILLALPVLAAGLGALALGLPSSSGPDWSEADLALVRSLALEALPPVPADPSNRVAGDPRAVNLGRAIFFDPRFSATGEVACASCHLPDRQFQTTGHWRGASAGPTAAQYRSQGRALLHKSGDVLTSPFPGQTYLETSVRGVPSAVNRFRTATRTWNSAT